MKTLIPPSFTVTKSTVESYKIRFNKIGYWADINIDSGERSGRIQIASDFGDWQYYWGACGKSFKEFLTKLNIEYCADKFGCGRWFDHAKTITSWKEYLFEQRRNDYVSQKDARTIYEQIKELEDCDEQNVFNALVWEKHELMELFDHNPDICHDVNPLFKRFWNEIWKPVFVEALKNELTETVPET